MKILKRLLILILILTLLLLGIIGLCAINPKLSDSFGRVLYGKNGVAPTPKPSTATEYQLPANPPAVSYDGEVTPSDNVYPLPEYGVYEVPDISALEIPSEVANLTGYEPIAETEVSVDDPTADEIEDTLGPGETGDDLTFDALFYPFYHMLNDKEKHLYRQVVANANALIDRFSPIEDCNKGELKRVMEAVFNDHPELFWLDTAYSYSQRPNGKIVEIDLKFNRTADNIDASKALFNENAEAILSGARGLGSPFRMEKYVHDALADKITYNLGAPMNQSAYSALVNGSTVCAGYARAFQYLMQQLGVPCYYCTGFAGENHAWNIIKLDDDFYNVDVTWDDSEKGNYDWFNKSDDKYASTHVRRDMSVNLPPCNGQGYQVESEKESSTLGDEPDLNDAGSAVGTQLPFEEAGYGETVPNGENAADNADALRSFADTGLWAEDLFNDMQGYYEDCKKNIEDNGLGSYSFQNIIVGEDMFKRWQQVYNNGSYKRLYMEEAMEEIGAKNCQMSLEVEPLQDDMYLVTHHVDMR